MTTLDPSRLFGPVEDRFHRVLIGYHSFARINAEPVSPCRLALSDARLAARIGLAQGSAYGRTHSARILAPRVLRSTVLSAHCSDRSWVWSQQCSVEKLIDDEDQDVVGDHFQ